MLYESIFYYSINISYILYFIVLFGIIEFAPYYLNSIRQFLKIYIGLLLVILYNSITFKYRSKKISEFDRKLIFNSGCFLLLSAEVLHSVEGGWGCQSGGGVSPASTTGHRPGSPKSGPTKNTRRSDPPRLGPALYRRTAGWE